MWTNGTIEDVLALIQNGINCKQDKSGVGEKITRIETISNSSIDYTKTGFSELDEKQKAKAKLEAGDILFSHINSPIHVGKTALYDGKEPLFHGINLLRLRTIDAVDSSYFNMFLVSLFQSGYWKKTAKQSVNQASVNQTDIKSVPFSYPSLAEQQRIVAKLDAAFAEIDKAIKLVETKQANAEKMKASLLDASLKGDDALCKTVKLGDITTVIAGQSPKGKYYNKDGKGTPFYQGKKDFGEYYLNPPTVWTDVVTKKAEKDDILMSVRAPVGALNIATQQICIGRGLAAIRPTSDILHDYLFYSLLSISHQLEGSAGAIFNSINKKQIEEISVRLPPLAEQQCIVAKLTDAFAEIDTVFATAALAKENYTALKSATLAQELSPSEAA